MVPVVLTTIFQPGMQGWTALHYAAASLTAHSETMQLAETLIDAGADVNAQDEQVPCPITQMCIASVQ